MLKKAVKIWREEGILDLMERSLKFGYDEKIRPLLPKRTVLYNDVPVRASRLGDSLVPWQSRDIPGYEAALVDGIQQLVKTGDTGVVVGGGWGVTTVAVSTKAGESGRTITFEGGAETVEKVQETVEMNGIVDRVTIRHAVVGEGKSLRGEQGDADIVPPTDLPECDVLVLDCEGAEIGIIESMEIRPRVILVETHGIYNATETDVRNRLDEAGYETVKSQVAENRVEETCKKKGIYVLFALRKDSYEGD